LFLRGLIACGLCAVYLACSPASTGYPYAQEPDPRRSEYVLGVTDGISVRVWRNPDLSLDATVMPDGTITMPLIGPVQVAEKTPSEVQKLIAQALKAYVKDAVVTVALSRVSSYRVTVSGEVTKPGVIEATRYLTVSEAILLAGGTTRFASPNDTVLVRTGQDGKIRRIPIQFGEIQAGRRPEQDLVLFRGDRINVP
jgi:polysaccharide export outer membrane protein